MMPKEDELSVALVPGFAKLGWLNRSNASIRIWNDKPSVILVVFSSDASTSAKPGPCAALRDILPKPVGIWNTQFAVAGALQTMVFWLWNHVTVGAMAVPEIVLV